MGNVPTKILIADDHAIFRRGLRSIIEADPALSVVAEAGDGAAALALIETTPLDLAVLDLHMPRMSGLDLLRSIRRQRLRVPIVVLTMYNDEATFHAVMDLGAQGYVLKDSAMTEIAACIRAVTAGQPYVTPCISQYLLNRYKREEAFQHDRPGLARLTPTERRILKLIAESRTSREIGETLRLDVRTVEDYRSAICAKAGVHGSHALVKFALQHRSELF